MHADRRSLARVALGALALAIGPLSGSTWAFMDNGGRISRDQATATFNGEELVFLTYQGTGAKRFPLTLYAFCADGDCDSAARPTQFASPSACTIDGAAPVWNPTNEQGQDRCDDEPCFWSVELPNSRGNASYAPPVVSASPGRVFVATTDAGGGGTIWSFEFDGGCRWGLKPVDNDDAQGGFYARPAVGPPAQGHNGVLLYAPSFKNSRMHVIFESDGAVTRPCPVPPAVSPGCHYVELFRVDDDPGSGGAQVDFEPIVEPCPTGDDAVAGCFGRVYVGGEQGSSKRGLYAFNVGATNPPDLDPWTILDAALTMRLGGVVLDGSDGRFLVADAWGKDGSGVAEPWPACAGEGIPTTSWSSPVVHPLGEYVFLGSRNGSNGDGGLYRLAQPDDDGCPAEREATNWFPYIPANGWRTTAVFTGVETDKELVHFGSSEDEVFALRTFAAGNGADVCAQVEWCEDLNTGVGGACDSPNGIACCQAAGCS